MTTHALNRPCGVDVLSVIAKHRDAHKSLSEADAYSAQEYPRLAAAYDVVAELIEADREFDAASLGYNPLFADRAQVDRYHLAVSRRAAALAAVEGQP